MTMRTLALAAAVALAGTGAVLAQTPTAPTTPPPATAPNGAGTVAPQSGATGAPGAVTGTPTGQPADTMSTDSAAGGNAGQPSRATPQGGGGGGGK